MGICDRNMPLIVVECCAYLLRSCTNGLYSTKYVSSTSLGNTIAI